MLETDGRGTGIRPFPRIGSITLEGGGRGGGKNIFSLVSRQFSTLDVWYFVTRIGCFRSEVREDVGESLRREHFPDEIFIVFFFFFGNVGGRM